MVCPHCQSACIRKLNRRTELGYQVFRCGACRRKSNERTGTPFNYLELPTDIVFEIVLCRLRYNLSLRNLAEMFLLRGFEFTHEAVREWEERFAPLLAEHLRRKRKGKVGRRWYVDETYLKVKGKWCYLYRAIDREGNLVDSMLSATRTMNARSVKLFMRHGHNTGAGLPDVACIERDRPGYLGRSARGTAGRLLSPDAGARHENAQRTR
jgi:putative transposase